MKRISRLPLIFMILFSFVLFSCGQEPEEVLNQFEKTYNNGDINALMSLFNEDAVIDLNAVQKLNTQKEIKNYFEYENKLSSKIRFSDFVTSDNKTFFVMSKTSDLLKTIGIDTAKYSMTFVLSENKINEISIKPTNETSYRLENFNQPFMIWAEKEHPYELKTILPGSYINYTKENAKIYLQMIIDWKKSRTTELVEQK